MPHHPATSFASHPNFDRAAYLAGEVWLTEVKPAAVRWHWPGRIPLGSLTLLMSDPGVGKCLLTLDIAAPVSSAAPWLRWWYSLRTLLIATTVVAVLLGLSHTRSSIVHTPATTTLARRRFSRFRLRWLLLLFIPLSVLLTIYSRNELQRHPITFAYVQ